MAKLQVPQRAGSAGVEATNAGDTEGRGPPRKPYRSLSHGSVGETLLTFAGAGTISTPPGTSGLLAFEWDQRNDGYDTIKRWPRRPPQAAFIPLLASRYSRDGSHPRPLCGCRDSGHARR